MRRSEKKIVTLGERSGVSFAVVETSARLVRIWLTLEILVIVNHTLRKNGMKMGFHRLFIIASL